MFLAVGMGKYGTVHGIGAIHPTQAECFKAFPEAFNASLRHHMAMDYQRFAIVEFVDAIEMAQPPQFVVAPLINLLPPPAAPATAPEIDDEVPF